MAALHRSAAEPENDRKLWSINRDHEDLLEKMLFSKIELIIVLITVA